MPQLDPTWFASQLFWLAVTFVMIYVILAKMALPPLMEIIERRKQTVEGDISQAQTLKSQAEQAPRSLHQHNPNVQFNAKYRARDIMICS